MVNRLRKMAKMLKYSANIKNLVEKSVDAGKIEPGLQRELEKEFEKAGEDWAKEVIKYTDWESEIRNSDVLENLGLPPYDPRDIEEIVFDDIIPGIQENYQQSADWAYSPYHSFSAFEKYLDWRRSGEVNRDLEEEFYDLFEDLQDSFEVGAYRVFERYIPGIVKEIAREF